jgi:LemA protein
VLVSTRSEESRTGWLGFGVAALLICALGGVIAGAAMMLSPDAPGRPTAWLPGVGAAAVLLTLAWSVILYNRLRLLAESTERAWTLIDVQLQRRHDLVPALAKVVAAHAAHESAVFTAVAQARGGPGAAEAHRSSAQLEDEATEQTGRLREILGVAEQNPRLTADASFLELQRQLSDTESRIAGSRTFYNDTLLLLRNRMHTFPGVLFAGRLRLTHRDPFAARGFERTVPALERTFA